MTYLKVSNFSWQAKYLKFGSYEKNRSWSITHLSHAMRGSDQQSQGSKATGVRSKIMIANEYINDWNISYIFILYLFLLLLYYYDCYWFLLLYHYYYSDLKKKILSMIIPLKSIGFWGVKMVKSSMIFHWRISPPFFSVNCTINLIEAIWRWFPLLNIIPVRSQWGRYTWPGFLLMTNHHMGLSDNRLIPSILPL
jgi:hypothetical protein